MKPKTMAILVAVVLLLAVLLPNMRREPIQLLFWSIEMPLLVMIAGSLFLGWLGGWFTHMAYHKGKSKRYPQADPQQHGSRTEPSTATPSVGEETAEK